MALLEDDYNKTAHAPPMAQKALAQHYTVVYGDHQQKLVDLCDLLDIEVI